MRAQPLVQVLASVQPLQPAPGLAAQSAAPVGATDTNRFWLFPNPGRDPASGVFATNEASYAQAYYDAIDPTDARATLNGFKTTNAFGTTVAGVSEVGKG